MDLKVNVTGNVPHGRKRAVTPLRHLAIDQINNCTPGAMFTPVAKTERLRTALGAYAARLARRHSVMAG
jgi:hypothetical protein